MGLLDGKVAIITGAGNGIGRCHALLFAREGARVVVNDLGGDRGGDGTSSSAADKVVEEIKAAGGEAVANYASVADAAGAQSIIETAVEAFGRADILVNNAGILRDKTLLKLEEGHWDLVIAVHLKGTFLCGQAFARHVKQRAEAGDAGGRIINTSSYAGLKGNFGQSNYSAAKAGIAGLTRTWAQELARFGVNVNAIAPMAKTRMTEDISVIPDDMTAEQISPMVLYLCSELSDEVSGAIFGIHGQQLFEYRMEMTEGVTKSGKDLWTAGEISEALTRIRALGAADAPAAAGSTGSPPAAPAGPEGIIDLAFEGMPQLFLADRAAGWEANIQFQIQGASDWSILVSGSECRTVKGLEGEPTCTVSVDAETWAGVLTGKEKAEQAFMAGKIGATNMGDMMKLGMVFDLKKAAGMLEEALAAAPAASGSAPAPAAPPGPAQLIDMAFAGMPQLFLADRAAGWEANIQFQIQGASDWSILVSGGECRTVKGLEGDATCTVTVDAETWAGVLTGKEKAEQAFMAGKIGATNMGDMMKLGMVFDLKKAAGLLEEALSAAPAATPAAPAGPDALARSVALSFETLPEAFRAKAAASKAARWHFEVAGAENFTVAVADGACTVEKGLTGTPSCRVKVDAESWSDVVRGVETPDKAYMGGRIAADHLPDVMLFSAAFDFKVLAAALAGMPAPESGAAEEAGEEPDLITQAFTLMPQVFRPERAKGWDAVLHFALGEGHEWSVHIADGECRTERGLTGEPSCVVEADAETWGGIVAGTLRPEQAFMEQKIRASNLGDMMKFGSAFDMKKAKALAEEQKSAAKPAPKAEKPAAPKPAAPKPAAPKAESKTLNRDYLGKVYSGGHEWVTKEHTLAYAAATNDPNPRYTDESREGGIVAPLLFPVRLLKEPLFKIMTDPGLNCDLLRLVHGEQDMVFHELLRPGDLSVLRTEIAGIEEKSTGELLHVAGRIYREGELVVSCRSSMFIRDPNKQKPKGGKPKKEAPELPKPEYEIAMTVDEDQSLRYADASLDNNPIHTDPGVAKMAGLPGIILHGLCTMAFTSQAVVNQYADGDPSRVKRLSVRFSKPVLMGQTVTTQLWTDGEQDGLTRVGFRAVNDEGEGVIENGLALVAPA